ncbi:MAG: hypothetical protein ACK5MQ_17165 [Pikeienuella sp.]
MTFRLTSLAFALLAGAASADAAALCERADPTLLWAGCDARATLLLLPEDAGPTPAAALDVTGGYTASDRREEGRPKPVGLFAREGEIISREYARFDGVLLIDGAGAPRILYRRRAEIGGRAYDLDDVAAREAFMQAVAAEKGAVIQSHLLIVDGEIDAFESEDAPEFRRRILFQTETGEIGVYDSGLRALTLAAAAAEVAAKFAPAMALNLDMGSYDFCRMGERNCGLLTYEETGKLSNILRFTQD